MDQPRTFTGAQRIDAHRCVAEASPPGAWWLHLESTTCCWQRSLSVTRLAHQPGSSRNAGGRWRAGAPRHGGHGSAREGPRRCRGPYPAPWAGLPASIHADRPGARFGGTAAREPSAGLGGRQNRLTAWSRHLNCRHRAGFAVCPGAGGIQPGTFTVATRPGGTRSARTGPCSPAPWHLDWHCPAPGAARPPRAQRPRRRIART